MRITNNPIADSVVFRILAISKAIRSGTVQLIPSKPSRDKVISIGRNAEGVLEAKTTDADGSVSTTVFQRAPVNREIVPAPDTDLAPPIPTEPEVLAVPAVGADVPGLDKTNIDITDGLLKL